MKRCGLFAEWQPRYAEHGIATFPVKGKTPGVRGYLKVGPDASRNLAQKCGDAAAFGFALKPAGLVIVDVDTQDENMLAEALERHGATPIVVRSGSGNYQAWYRRQGEGRLIRPDPNRPVDILGDGFVVAPPSIVASGRYELIQGALADLKRLPLLRNAPEASRMPDLPVGSGNRNDALWRRCMEQARRCDDYEALLDVARTRNADFDPPLPDAEVDKTARSAWGYTLRGDNRIGRRVVVAAHSEVDELLDRHPDAFILLMFLRRHNRGEHFLVANGLSERMPDGGWPRKRLAAARKQLVQSGLLVEIRAASTFGGPAIYSFKAGHF